MSDIWGRLYPLLVLAVAVLGCGTSHPPCACPAVSDPVCAVDGRTFANPCEAACARVEVRCAGGCPCPTPCGDGTCASGETCLNCEADCGACPPGCGECVGNDECRIGEVCNASSLCLPSCGCPACAVCAGHCAPCACPFLYAPVCGVDGTTYGNSCEANCARVAIACNGECPCDCERDPSICAAGEGCFCGGPGNTRRCGCGLLCATDADCSDPAQPYCCLRGPGDAGVCTDYCTCFCR